MSVGSNPTALRTIIDNYLKKVFKGNLDIKLKADFIRKNIGSVNMC